MAGKPQPMHSSSLIDFGDEDDDFKSPSNSAFEDLWNNDSPAAPSLDLLTDSFNSKLNTQTESPLWDNDVATYQSVRSGNPFDASSSYHHQVSYSGHPFESPTGANFGNSPQLFHCADEDWFAKPQGNLQLQEHETDDWPDLNPQLQAHVEAEDWPKPNEGLSKHQFSNNGNEFRQEQQSKNKSNSMPCLEEFEGAAAERSIFKAPVREPLRPGRPAYLELRPHPLRETQECQATSVIASTGVSLWAGLECGIAIWEFENISGVGQAESINPLLGDEDAAPYILVSLDDSATSCLFTDYVRRLVWSGHKDGWIRAWPIDASKSDDLKMAWKACDGPVLSIVVTYLGDLWVGSESGLISAWERKLVDHALSFYVKSYSNVVLDLQTNAINLRDQVGPAAPSVINSDVKFLVSDAKQEKVWSAGLSSLALWDIHSKELIRSMALDGQIEFSGGNTMFDQYGRPEDNYRPKMSRVQSKEKTQGGWSFFQRSKNALMGAAGAVCRATIGSQLLDDGRRLRSMLALPDGTIWTGQANGLLVHWDCEGQRVNEVQHANVAVLCLCLAGENLWVGYDDGRVHVLQYNGKLLKGWPAHASGVVQMTVGRGHVFTLAAHGGIRGWHINIRSPVDASLRSTLIERESTYTREEHVKIFTSTWNVSQERASFESLSSWLSPSYEAGIVVVGLQEMEMGAGVLALAAAKETVGIEGSANGNWWLDNISVAIGTDQFALVGSRQLAGLLVGAWSRKELLAYVGDVDVGAVACGFGRTFGNKGAVAIRMKVFRKTICVVNCHLAAHTEGLSRRNADFEYIYQNMTFGRSSIGVSGGVSSAVQTFLGSNVRRSSQNFELDWNDSNRNVPSLSSGGLANQGGLPELTEADMTIWLGDFNYRLHDISYEDAVSYIKKKHLQALLKYDQLRIEMSAGRVFQGLREGHINFPPTYKFDRGTDNLHGYDSSEKKRVPAWCDRILFRDNRNGKTVKSGLSCPVLSFVEWYNSCMNVCDSDHKPVMAMFNATIAFIDEAIRRRLYWESYSKLDEANDARSWR